MRRETAKRAKPPEHPGIDEGDRRPAGEVGELFEAFYEREHDRLYRALYLLTGTSHEAEELMQDAFVRVWERWLVRGAPDDPVAYLYRTAMNAFRMGYRRAQVSMRHLLRPAPPRDQFEEVDLSEDVHRAMSSLTRRQRQALVLTAFLGYGPADAAAILRVKPSTVRVLTTQARSVMRDAMEGRT